MPAPASPPTPKMHEDEFDVTEVVVHGLIRRQFPELARKDLPLRPVPSTGTVNALYRLGDELVVRLPRTARWHDVEREACWLRTVASRLPVAVPEVVATGAADDTYPWTWAIFRWIEGATWRPDRLHDLHAAAADVADVVHAVQAIDPASAACGDDWTKTHVPSLGRVDESVRSATAAAEAAGLVDGARLLDAWEAALAVPKWQGPRPLLHSDLLAFNLLVSEGRLAAVIDWSSVTVGDPARELMAAWNLFDDASRATFRSAVGFDDATWARARGWALTRINGVAYYATTNPEFSEDARRVIAAVLDDRVTPR